MTFDSQIKYPHGRLDFFFVLNYKLKKKNIFLYDNKIILPNMIKKKYVLMKDKINFFYYLAKIRKFL